VRAPFEVSSGYNVHGSAHGHAAVDGVGLAGDVGGRWIQGKELHQPCNLLWLPVPPCSRQEGMLAGKRLTWLALHMLPPRNCRMHEAGAAMQCTAAAALVPTQDKPTCDGRVGST
jgi:hypothetical protein